MPLIAIFFLILSVVGLITGNTFGGFTYLLFILAIALFLLRWAQRPRAVQHG